MVCYKLLEGDSVEMEVGLSMTIIVVWCRKSKGKFNTSKGWVILYLNFQISGDDVIAIEYVSIEMH